ncbi:MAG: glycerophosphodiester phosphodiesterase [Anaerolineae bacterium]
MAHCARRSPRRLPGRPGTPTIATSRLKRGPACILYSTTQTLHPGPSRRVGLRPENTLAAFTAAVQAGADIIETDLWFTADGRPGLSPRCDAQAHRPDGGPRRPDGGAAHGLAADQSPMGARWQSEHIPTLAEALAVIPMGVMLAVELKGPAFCPARLGRKLVRLVETRIEQRQIVALAFQRPRLDAMLRACLASTGYISVIEPIPVAHSRILGPFWPTLYASGLCPSRAHRQGQWVCRWIRDPEKRLARYLRLGVDAVAGNNPAALRVQIDQLVASADGR